MRRASSYFLAQGCAGVVAVTMLGVFVFSGCRALAPWSQLALAVTAIVGLTAAIYRPWSQGIADRFERLPSYIGGPIYSNAWTWRSGGVVLAGLSILTIVWSLSWCR